VSDPGLGGAPFTVSHVRRARRYETMSSELVARSDRAVAELLRRARVRGSGIGGTSVTLEIAGTPVFAKLIPLTALECEPQHEMSTANLFGLPASCHYGVGSPGFGAWREVAANALTTTWVLAGQTAAFPLLYHWRVLPEAPQPSPGHADVEASTRYWGGSPAVRARLRALSRASACLVLFQEFIPHTLDHWLATQRSAGPDSVTSAITMVESCLLTDLTFMGAKDLRHFDTHFGNILTDGSRLYFADLGLATSSRFDLSAEESALLRENRTYDLAHSLTRLVNWLVTNVSGVATPPDGDPTVRNQRVRAFAAGEVPTGVPPAAAAMIGRHAPVAALMNDFHWDLFGVDRATPYPRASVEQALRASGMTPDDA
jgi:hypothetical protein